MRYTDWNTSPMRWHYVLICFLSLGLLYNAFYLFTDLDNFLAFQNMGYGSIYAVTIFLSIATVTVQVCALTGLVRRKWSGPCCAIASYGLSALASFISAVILPVLITLSPTSVMTSLSALVSALCFGGCSFVYYQKRRLLFSPMPADISADEENARATQTYTPTISNPPAPQPYVPTKVAATVAAPVSPTYEAPKGYQEPWEKSDVETRTYGPLDAPAKKKSPAALITAIASSCLSVAFLIALVFTMYQLSEANAQIETLSQQKSIVESMYKTEQSKRNSLTDQFIDLQAKYNDAVKYKDFLNKYIGFIVDGSSTYHTKDCPIFTAVDEFTAHNVNYCDYLGYSPCPECH